jgi:hypothetical protein
MIVQMPFQIHDLAGNLLTTIDIPCERDPDLPEDCELMTEEGSAAVQNTRRHLLRDTFWLVEYEGRHSVVHVVAIPEADIKSRKAYLGFYAPGNSALQPLSHATWIRQLYPRPKPDDETLEHAFEWFEQQMNAEAKL